MTGNHLKVGIVCGEQSGDLLGSELIQELKKYKNVKLFGIGGPKLKNLGLNSYFDFEELQIMGIVEPLLNYKRISNRRKQLIKNFKKEKIDIFIGIDSPDFNISIHKQLKKEQICKNIQVVSPSVWAWRQNRIKAILKYIDLTLCLFNFEHKFYQEVGHTSSHLGHPFSKIEKISKHYVFDKFQLDQAKKYVSVLPGSRESEIKYMLPIYKDFIELHSGENPDYIYLIPTSNEKLHKEIEKIIGANKNVIIRMNSIREFLSISEFSVVTSGTASLESAILECPPIICYKTNPINYFIISKMLKVQNVGLPNLLLRKKIFPELIQKECNSENINKAINELDRIISKSSEIQDELKQGLCGIGPNNACKLILGL